MGNSGFIARNILATSVFARTRALVRKYFYFEMTKRNLRLFTLFLACLTQPALCMGQDSNSQPSDEVSQASKPADFNTDIYYRNKLEFSLETGVLPINIPFVFDFFVGGNYNWQNPLHYTLVPIFPSLRWQMGTVRGPWILRGNTDLTLTLSFTAIPRGPETRYGAFDLGVRRNFVHRNWRVAPYFELRGGAGFINAKGPDGVPWAQGGDFTFTLMLGSGVRYNFNPRYSMDFGASYMHVSDAYLCHPSYCDNGINVYGPMVGFNVRLGKPKQESSQ
ncbi:MAG: acyloxyacyl hydrolase [Candidatus Acidiferrales bacterium]|jgi:hypothetical protein